MGPLGALVAAVLCLVHFVSAQDVATHCFKDSQKKGKVHLDCPPKFTIVIQDVFYGSNSYKECANTIDTCRESLPRFDKSVCSGMRNCSLATRRIYSVECGGYVDFFRVIYECFPVVVPRNYTFAPPTTVLNTPEVPKLFGMDRPIRDSEKPTSEVSTGMILAVVGCVLGTLYVSIVCIVLAVMFRRNDPKKSLAADEERPTELDNSAFKGSGHRLPTVPENSSETEYQTREGRDLNRNVTTSRQGPDGREIEAQVFQETETPVSRISRGRNSHYNNNIQHSGSIEPKSLFVTKENEILQQPTHVETRFSDKISSEAVLRDASSC